MCKMKIYLLHGVSLWFNFESPNNKIKLTHVRQFIHQK
jgi:hypothetical protein